jgi:hypothetical protein
MDCSFGRITNKIGTVAKALLIAVTVATSSVSLSAEHFVILTDSPLPNPQVAITGRPEIEFAGTSGDDGFLLAGKQGTYGGWVGQVSKDSTVKWETAFSRQWPEMGARALVDANDGGFLVVGHGQSFDTAEAERNAVDPMRRLEIVEAAGYDHLTRLDKSGKVMWERRLFEGHERYSYCARETSDGVVVLGFTERTYQLAGTRLQPERIFVPSLTKIDLDGHIQWDRALVDDNLPALESSLIWHLSCTGLRVSRNGQVTVAVTVDEIKNAAKTAQGIVLPADYDNNTSNRGTLVVQLDREGHVLHSIRTPDAFNAFLFDDGSGFSLVEYLRYKLDRQKLAIADLLHKMLAAYTNASKAGVRITRLNQQLQTIDSVEISMPSFSDRLSAVLPARGGGYFVTGCDIDGFNSIARITASGSVSATLRIRPSDNINQCDTMGLAYAGADDEVLVFYGGRLDGNNVALLKLMRE